MKKNMKISVFRNQIFVLAACLLLCGSVACGSSGDQPANVEKETAVENIARAKGYEEISVYIDGDAVDIAVRKAEFSENDAVILKEIATEQLKISSKNIKIVEIK